MQFLKVVSLGLITAAYASPLVARDAQPILSAIAAISAGVESIDGAIDDFTATSDTKKVVADMTAKSNALIATIKDQTAKVNAAAAVSVTDAAAVTKAATGLTDLVAHVVGAFTDKKDIIAKDGQTALVAHHLNDQRAAAVAFIAAVSSKVPASLTAAAKQIGDQTIAAIDKGITAFGGMPGMAMGM